MSRKSLPRPIKGQEYWESKHPVTFQMYSGRPLPTGDPYELDVRHFIWDKDIDLMYVAAENDLRGNSNDDTATNVQRFVVEYMKYVSDKTLGRPEYWLFPAETLALKQGDCEDGAILIASILISLLPDEHKWRVRVTAGWVEAGRGASQGGHAYVTYCRCKDNEWVVLDWCYYEDSIVPVKDKPLLKSIDKYKNVWFSFNHLSSWSHMDFEMKGRVNNAGN